MIDFDPAIDRICEILNCTPGEAPGIVAKMFQVNSADKPPNDYRAVLVYGQWHTSPRIARWHPDDKWWLSDESVDLLNDVVAWRELPPAPKEEK